MAEQPEHKEKKKQKKPSEQQKTQEKTEEDIKYAKLSDDDIKEKLDQGFIHIRAIIELMGAPKEHIQNTLKKYVEKISNDDSLILLNAEFSEPKEAEETDGKFFMCFVEVEMLAKSISTVSFFCFDYMPSSVEIISPENVQYKSAELSNFFNDIQARLHSLDKFLKDTLAKQKNLLRNSNRLLRNNIIIVISHDGPLSSEELSKKVGITSEQLNPFLDAMVNDNYLKKEGDKFSLMKK